MSFRVKLLLAFFLVISLVASSIIWLTGNRVRYSYQRQFEQSFESQVQYLFESREQRTRTWKSIAKELAGSDKIIDLLKDDKAIPPNKRREFLRDITTGLTSNRQQAFSQQVKAGYSKPRLSPFVAVMNLDGEIEQLSSNRERGKGASQRGRAFRHGLSRLERQEEQQVAYVEQITAQGEKAIREVIVTPVRNEESELLGAFLLSLAPVRTGAERFVTEYNDQMGDDKFDKALLFAGRVYPSAGFDGQEPRVQSPAFKDLETIMAGELARLSENVARGTVEADLQGQPHYIHYCALNPDLPMESAWQISAFPTATLHSELRELSMQGGAIGVAGLLIGVVAAWFLAKNFSIPIRALSDGTAKIRRGELETQLPLRSKDEIGELTRSFNDMVHELRAKERYRNLLGKVSDETVAQAMIDGSLNPELGGELKSVSILFCDIRGFTKLIEAMNPDEVIGLLNTHMTAMARVVKEHGGVVDKFIGDEIMAVFGGLRSHGDDTQNAICCAVRMLEERVRLNHEHGQAIEVGIGLASGEAVAGCMGSDDRLNYTVLGARVNMGARLCGKAGAGQLIVDDSSYQLTQHLRLPFEEIEGLMLKGFRSEVRAWRYTCEC